MSIRLASTGLALLLTAACNSPEPAFPDGGPALDAPAPDADPCAQPLAPAPMSWVLLFDHSGSWTTRSDRFDGLKDAVAGFAAAHPELPLAAVDFPRLDGSQASCDALAYERLDPGPRAPAGTLAQAVRGWQAGGASPLGPAITGAGRSARGGRAQDSRAHAVVVLTDATPGEDETCGTWDDTAAAAAEVFDHGAFPGVPVHVVSVMGTAVAADHLPRLAGIAEAGGGYAAFVNGSRSDVAASARQALEDIAARGLCTLALPAGSSRPDTITITSPDGVATVASRVPDASLCHAEGFFVDDSVNPTTATLCSGPAGVGGLCELTFVRARAVGAPTFEMTDPPAIGCGGI